MSVCDELFLSWTIADVFSAHSKSTRTHISLGRRLYYRKFSGRRIASHSDGVVFYAVTYTWRWRSLTADSLPGQCIVAVKQPVKTLCHRSFCRSFPVLSATGLSKPNPKTPGLNRTACLNRRQTDDTERRRRSPAVTERRYASFSTGNASMFSRHPGRKQTTVCRPTYTVCLKKTSPTFLAVTRESIVEFS